MTDNHEKRVRDFERRAGYAPASVYRHPDTGWRYIPIHPFGDEADSLSRLSMRPEDCWGVDAWTLLGGDATLVETRTSAVGGPPGLHAHGPHEDKRWVYLTAVFNAPYITRSMFEAALSWFAEMGFPDGPDFRFDVTHQRRRIGDIPRGFGG